ncbi:MAG TPA: anthranilate synthase component I, partial [Candidatus Omnitrophota bacterium]|nr:anthranilate synthase component I [Candidatus Omnitrophota bacterium]
MIYPSFEEFKKLAKKGNVVPVYLEILADLETPVSAFLKLGKSDYSFLLESVESQENVGRYSFLGSEPSLVFSSKGHNVTIRGAKGSKTVSREFECSSPFEEIRRIVDGFKFVQVD